MRKGGVKAPHTWNKGVEKGDIMVHTVESAAPDVERFRAIVMHVWTRLAHSLRLQKEALKSDQ